MSKLRGVFIVLATPFTQDGTIDKEGFGRNLDHYVDAKVDGVMVTGALGEYLSMSLEERKALVAFASKRLDGRIPFMVGTTAHRTEHVIDLSNHAKEHGAAGVMILPSPGTGLLEDEIFAYYESITSKINIPVQLYNNPGSSGMDMEFDLVKKLSALPNVEAIKEASGDIKRITRICDELKGKLTPFCGWEDMHHESFLAGATGWVCMGGNFAPGLTRDLLANVIQGNIQKARELTARYNPVARYMENAGKVTQTTKYIMDKVGLVGGFVRPPKQPLTAQEKANIDAVIKGVDLY